MEEATDKSKIVFYFRRLLLVLVWENYIHTPEKLLQACSHSRQALAHSWQWSISCFSHSSAHNLHSSSHSLIKCSASNIRNWVAHNHKLALIKMNITQRQSASIPARIIWWEKQRIVYNLIMAVIGFASFFIGYMTIPLVYILVHPD